LIALVVTRGKDVSVGRKGNRIDLDGFRVELADDLPARRVPQDYASIVAARSEMLAVRGEADCDDMVGNPLRSAASSLVFTSHNLTAFSL
jgi:hypothetical protein